MNRILVAGYILLNVNKISIGVWRDQMWPDGWTAVTADGKRSAQFEHTLLVTVQFLLFCFGGNMFATSFAAIALDC